MGAGEKTIVVCWGGLSLELPPGCKILSFLTPLADDQLSRRYSSSYVSGHLIAQQIKEEALQLYTDVVARIGAERVYEGKSLRESIKDRAGNSQWWYHPVSFKDCEADPIFNQLIQVLVIDRVASADSITNLILWGGDANIVRVLKSKYTVEHKLTKSSSFSSFFKAILKRGKGFTRHIYHWYTIRNLVKDTVCKPAIVFEGFWDWSIESGENGHLKDRYLKSLPNCLNKKSLETAWFLWFEPHIEPGSGAPSVMTVLTAANQHHNLIFLQKFLTIWDIIREFLNYYPVWIYLKQNGHPHFRNLFHYNQIDLYALFRQQLLYNFLNDILPHHSLVAKASERAFAHYKPKVAFTFLELFLYSRAFYNGARSGSPKTIIATMQHASYSREKTFIRIDPNLEYSGNHDNCMMPKPDYIFAMGELGKTIFEECGFPTDRILLTGSSRYEHISGMHVHNIRPSEGKIRLLMVTAFDRDLELNMVEAVYIASKDMPEIQLYLRNHPFAKMDSHPKFNLFKDRIHVTDKSLEEDLSNADLIIFSYSTVAEEALIQGIPVWQWRGATYNGSVFRDLDGAIPVFFCVSDLREAIEAFVQNADSFSPTDEIRLHVLRNCFYLADGKASERIAECISRIISSPPVSTDLSS